jgi:hypothetical protein
MSASEDVPNARTQTDFLNLITNSWRKNAVNFLDCGLYLIAAHAGCRPLSTKRC